MNEELIFSLLESRNIKELRPILEAMNPADIAKVLIDVDEKELPIVFRLLSKDMAADTFVEMDNDMQESLITKFSDMELKLIIDELFMDDTVDIIEEMPANVVRRILNQSTPQDRAIINELLKYPEDSAGSIMTTEYVKLSKDMKVSDAFANIRKTGVDKETIYTCYVTNNQRKLEGLITVKTLLLSDQDTLISDIMETNIIYLETQTDKEEVANMFDRYNFMAMPVVDSESRLLGIVTIDDALDVITEEATEDISMIAGVVPTDTPYLKTSVWKLWLARAPWLMLLMISATLTGMIITKYESALAVNIVLTATIPMLMGTAGNAGSQVSVTIIRSMALGDIDFGDLFKVIWKETRVSILLGLTLSIVCFVKLLVIDRIYAYASGYWIGLVICLTMFATVVISKVVGCILPLVAKKIKLDPAVVASPFITTIVDALSLVIYCNIAILLLKPLGIM